MQTPDPPPMKIKLEELIRNGNILSNERISQINSLQVSENTSQRNMERIQTIVDTLQKDGYKTEFGNIVFRSAKDDRLQAEIGCHISYSKCQTFPTQSKEDAIFMSDAQNKMQFIQSYSMMAKASFEMNSLGIYLEDFNQLIDLLISNRNQPARHLATYLSLDNDFKVPRIVENSETSASSRAPSRKRNKKRKNPPKKRKRSEIDESVGIGERNPSIPSDVIPRKNRRYNFRPKRRKTNSLEFRVNFMLNFFHLQNPIK